jgi:hypothetical protein
LIFLFDKEMTFFKPARHWIRTFVTHEWEGTLKVSQ